MLRPASPLTVLLLAAFVLLLISVISTPIIKGIPLASEAGVDFGVFGFCSGSNCSPIEVGYSLDKLSASENSSFDFSVKTRKTLSAILIVHPVAALFTLIMLIMAIVAHFHSPSHSPRYLLCLFILGIFTFLLSLLCFLVDILLFIPHLAWGSYVVLAATILIAGSGLVSCAMRRTLVSRKARKKRIAENAEMSGENYYSRQAGATLPPIVTTTAPMVSGGLGAEPQTGTYASFEMQKSSTDPSRTSDERMPLTARTLSNGSPTGPNGGMIMPGVGGVNERYGSPARMGDPRGGMNGNGLRPYNGPRDEFGNPLPPSAAFGGPNRSRDPSQDSQMRNAYPGGPPPMRGRGGPMMRGRGGFGPPRRGGYGPPPGSRGGYGPPPPGRGGYGPGPNYRGGMMGPMAGGMAAGMAVGGRGPPPGYSGYNGPPPQGYQRSMSPPESGYDGGYSRRPSDPNAPPYGMERTPSQGTPNAQGYLAYPGHSDSSINLPRAESPPPLPGFGNNLPRGVGQAVEMDAMTGSPSRTPVGFDEFNNAQGTLRDSDADVAGMIGLQQSGLPAHLGQGNGRIISSTSFYSSDEPYVPPTEAWGEAGPPVARNPSPLTNAAIIPNEPVELPATSHSPVSHIRQDSSDNYHEDVDPRFIEPELQPRSNSAESYHAGSVAGSHAGSQRVGLRNNVTPPPLNLPNAASHVPGVAAYNSNLPPQNNNMGGLHPMSQSQAPIYDGADYDDVHALPPGARSPAESEGAQSNFTSISQRGINPRWQGDRGGPQANVGNMPRRPVPRNDQAILLNSNPDFELPGLGPGGRGGGNVRDVDALPRGGLIGGGRYPGS